MPDPLWELIEKVLTVYNPPAKTGRKRSDPRQAFDGIMYRMRTGCQWNHLPPGLGDDSSVYHAFARWEKKAIFDILWAILLTKCDDFRGVDWLWKAADGCLGKARGVPKSGVGPSPSDRSKSGVKKSVLAEGHGRPFATCISGANVPDTTLLKATLYAVVVVRPAPTAEAPQHLCLDRGYDNTPAAAVVLAAGIVLGAGYVPYIRRISEEKLDDQNQKTHPARRWVVKRTFAWLSRCSAILVRYDKRADRYLAMIKLASGLLWF